MILKSDCRHFPGDRPCRFNKESGQTCPDCGHYAPPGQRVLVIKLAALGDVLRTTAILPGIKAQWPDSYIVWLTLANTVELLQGNPLIDELWTVEEDTPTRLAAEEFDLVLNPDADKRAAGLASQARAAERRGMLLDRRGFIVPANPEAVAWLEMGAFDQVKKQNQKTYQQLIYAMLKLDYERQEIGLALKKSELAWARGFLTEQGWRERDKIVGLNLGGGGRWKKKRWKAWHFETFGRRITAESGCKVLLIGGEQERGLIDDLQKALPAGVLSTGPNRSLRETGALIAHCRVLVTGDTLALHIASALKVPTVVPLGPTSASELEMYGRGEKTVAPIGCVSCYLPDCDIDPDCMELITPATVLEATRKWL